MNVRLLVVAVTLLTACSSSPQPKAEKPPVEQTAEPEESAEKIDLSVPDGFVEAEVLEVLMTRQGHAVLLADDTQETVLPIFIGSTEAMAIQLRKERRRYQRPLTHDLLDEMVSRLGGELLKVHVDGLKSGVFVGRVFMRADGKIVEFDSRPSDAIALAVGNDLPIYVATSVFDQAGLTKEDLQEAPPVPQQSPDTTTKPL